MCHNFVKLGGGGRGCQMTCRVVGRPWPLEAPDTLDALNNLGSAWKAPPAGRELLKLNMKDRTDTELITKSQRAAINNISSPSENDQWWQLVNRLCRWTSLVTSFCPVRLIGAPMSVLWSDWFMGDDFEPNCPYAWADDPIERGFSSQ